jgi:hypothetical protein
MARQAPTTIHSRRTAPAGNGPVGVRVNRTRR